MSDIKKNSLVQYFKDNDLEQFKKTDEVLKNNKLVGENPNKWDHESYFFYSFEFYRCFYRARNKLEQWFKNDGKNLGITYLEQSELLVNAFDKYFDDVCKKNKNKSSSSSNKDTIPDSDKLNLFFTFCYISTFFRRNDLSKANEDFTKKQKYNEVFNSFKLYDFLKLMAEEKNLSNSSDKLIYIKKAYDLVIDNENNSGSIFSDFAIKNQALICYLGQLVADYYEDNLDKKDDDECYFYIAKVIDLFKKYEVEAGSNINLNGDPSKDGKFQATKGRILALDKDYTNALQCVKLGRSLDLDPDRRSECDNYILFITFLKAFEQMKTNTQKIKLDQIDVHKEVQNNESKLYKLGGGALIIIALLLGAVSITLKVNDVKVVSVILILFFISITVLASLFILFIIKPSKKKPLTNFIERNDIKTLYFLSTDKNYKQKYYEAFKPKERKRIEKQLVKYSIFCNNMKNWNLIVDDTSHFVIEKTREWLGFNKLYKTKNLLKYLAPILFILLGLGVILYFLYKFMT